MISSALGILLQLLRHHRRERPEAGDGGASRGLIPGKYFETLPLHQSQKKISADEDFTVFQYHLVPTFDFKQELLSRGPSVEVLTPTWFRDEVADDVAEMAKLYTR